MVICCKVCEYCLHLCEALTSPSPPPPSVVLLRNYVSSKLLMTSWIYQMCPSFFKRYERLRAVFY